MSIWGSHGDIGWDYDENKFDGGEVRAYANGWSNHYPSADVEAPASIGLADIPAYCVPGHDQSGENFTCSGCGEYHDAYPERGEWVRLDIDSLGALSWPEPIHASVVLDEQAARSLADALIAWAIRPVVRATTPPTDTASAAGGGDRG